METIHLPNGSWSYDPQVVLGEGGFGKVFGGTSDEHGSIAVKALTSLRDQRELQIAKELSRRDLRFVLPVLDCGLDADGTINYIVKPRADHCLADELKRRVALPATETASVLLDILCGLEELPDLIHRDLKPSNVLMHDGRWKLADFGLAKQVADATSTNTMRAHRSRPYAAPEQWREEHPTPATDIYALGCIAFELVEGRRAFPGNDFRQQHLESEPPIPSCEPFRLPIAMMLRKPPTSRVNTQRLRKLLEEIKEGGNDEDTAPEPQKRLRSISVSLEHRTAASEAAAMQAEEASVRREALVKVAREVLEDITDRLFDQIMTAAPQARIDRPMQSGRRNISLNNNELEIIVPTQPFPQTESKLSYSITAAGRILVKQASPAYVWGYSLIYAEERNAAHYRWYEVGFMHHPLIGLRGDSPFALAFSDIVNAMSPGMSKMQTAWGPVPIDDENEKEFVKEWLTLFVSACEGQLRYPSVLPLKQRPG